MTAAKIANLKFKLLPFSGDWGALIGQPPINFFIYVYADSGNGKTNFCIRYAKYLTKFKKVLYYSVEEGISYTTQSTIIRQGLIQEHDVVIGQYEPDKFDSPFDDLENELKKRNCPNIIFIDSLEYSDMNAKQIKNLRRMYPKKAFVVIGRAEGAKPLSAAGRSTYFDADVVLHMKDHTAYNLKPRYGGGEPFEIK